MDEDFSIFGRLNQLNPSGKPRDAKEVPVDQDGRRRQKGRRKKPGKVFPEGLDLEETGEEKNGHPQSGKVVDITV